MSTTTRSRPTGPAPSLRDNGNGGRPMTAAAPPRSRVRLPELAVGLFVTVVFALGAVLWHLNATTKVGALAVAAEIPRGEVIEASDLQVVYVASDGSIARMDPADSATVVGQVALVDLSAGSLVTPSLVAEAAALDAGEGRVGMALEPGQYPSLGLAPGDLVNVVRAGEVAPDGDATDHVIARGATVTEVDDLASDRKLVTILVPESDAEVVASLAGGGDLRLVVVAP